ncbi:S26 family signal peptidase [Gregarina niphandrodes]|uniref:S26 family signal peptidase n=1 Tax=Gregarina niphandrodes TaxID=110365 RepID=A0A023B100_GRENI|nr:S26 family signal peptidase [Gregarina niphandrodes]EZG46247.1 S26 family signal peptidase [Gregarina niphandrodes]|eukprot:XP_011132317.1 S26 family signal peptidase [Gregarina niphandrodes]
MGVTVPEGSKILIDKWTWKLLGGLCLGDVVVYGGIQDRWLCKRIAAIGPCSYKGLYIPKDYLWLEGDNSRNSLDSRYHGCVAMTDVVGKVWRYPSLKSWTQAEDWAGLWNWSKWGLSPFGLCLPAETTE